MKFEQWWREHYAKNIEVDAISTRMTWEQIIFLRNLAKVSYLAGLEAAAKIADSYADDEDSDNNGNTDKRMGAINTAESIRYEAERFKKETI